jgi:hypothetical protein
MAPRMVEYLKVNNEYLDLNELYKELHQILHHDKEWSKSPIYPILGLLNPAYYTYDPQRGTWTPIPQELRDENNSRS